MRFYKNNAYPEIFLHDCDFELKYENGNLIFSFDNGFCKQEEETKLVKGCIQIRDLPIEEVSIMAGRHYNLFGRWYEISKDISYSELLDYLKNSSLQVVDEFYNGSSLWYRCFVYPFHKRQKYYYIEICVDYSDKDLEYYLFDE